MIIHLIPQRRDDSAEIARQGDAIMIDGEGYDFSGLAEGDTLPHGTVPCDLIVGPVTRTGGHIVLTIIIPHGYSTVPVTQPDPIVDPPDGVVALPQFAAGAWVAALEDGGGDVES